MPHPLRSHPYRLFFPLGAVLGGFGVAHWLLYYTGVHESYSGQVHALLQVQAFLMSFACGFLMTMLPRRTQTAPAAWAEILLAVAGLIGTTVGAARNWWGLAEGAFLLTIAVLVQFAVRRFRSSAAGRTPPDAFVLIPIGLLHGIIGALLLLASGAGMPGAWVVAVGRGCIQEGMFLCLALGIGHMIVPLLSGFDVPQDANASAGSTRRRIGYALSGLVILASFPLHAVILNAGAGMAAVRVSYGLRLLVCAYHVIVSMRAYRPPATSGLHRRLVWVSFWFVLAGLALVVAFPLYRIAMLHVLFIGGFGLMAFSVGCHVILAHGDFEHLVRGRPWPVVLFALLSLAALLTRVTADFLATYFLHLALASAIWLAALACWMLFLVPKVFVVASGTPTPPQQPGSSDSP